MIGVQTQTPSLMFVTFKLLLSGQSNLK